MNDELSNFVFDGVGWRFILKKYYLKGWDGNKVKKSHPIATVGCDGFRSHQNGNNPEMSAMRSAIWGAILWLGTALESESERVWTRCWMTVGELFTQKRKRNEVMDVFAK